MAAAGRARRSQPPGAPCRPSGRGGYSPGTEARRATSSPDTAPAAERVQIELLRRATTAQRAALAISLSETAIALSRRAIRRAHPDWSEREVLLEWAALHYGRELSERVRAYLAARGDA